MKTLSVLFLLALGLGATWWKLDNPDGTLADARQHGESILQRLRGGVVAVRDGAAELPLSNATADAAASPPDRRDVEELTVRLDALEQASETRARTDADAQASLRASLEASPEAAPLTAEMEGVLSALPERLDAIDESMTALNTRTDEIGAAVATLGTRDEELASRLDTLASAAAPANAQESMQDSLQDTDNTASAANDNDDGPVSTDGDDASLLAMAATSTPTARMTERLDTLVNERLDALLEERGSPDGSGDTAGDDASPASLPSTDLEERLALLESRMSGLATITPDTDPLDSLQAELRQEIASLGERLDASVESDTSTGGDADEQVSNELAATRDRLANLEARVQALPVTSATAEDSQAAQALLEEQVNALEQQLESLPIKPDDELVSTISEVREQVDALSKSGFVTQDELRTITEGKSVEYKIYFDRNSIEVGVDASRVLDSFIRQEKNRTTGVSIFGFTDRAGDAAYNQRLALERATAVRSYLIQNGLDYTKIRAMSGFGEDAAAAVQPDDADDAQQRVVVLFAAQP